MKTFSRILQAITSGVPTWRSVFPCPNDFPVVNIHTYIVCWDETFPAVSVCAVFYFFSPFSASHGSQEPRSIPTAGEVMLHSDVSTALNNMTMGTLGSSPSSATSPDPTSISGDTLSSSGAGTHGAGSWQGDLITHPREPLLASSHSAFGRTFAGRWFGLKDGCCVVELGFALPSLRCSPVDNAVSGCWTCSCTGTGGRLGAVFSFQLKN